jgi:signal transduction histidine kinase
MALMLSWPRVRFTLGVAAIFGFIFSIGNDTPTLLWLIRAVFVSFAATLAFGLFEQKPRRLPKWLARSALQVIAVAFVIPPATAIVFTMTSQGDPAAKDEKQGMANFSKAAIMGILFAPWIAVGAMLKQRDAFAREQALAFELEKSELERKELDARLRLLQVRVEPHFIFNTLANVQALVDAGSPQASQVLASLIAYLKAAVPRVNATATTVGEEVELVRAYLAVMQMRMPDRLQFALRVDPAVQAMHCPSTTLLTLVENAVRHGIDVREEGGRIDVDASLRDGRCYLRVADTGAGLLTKNPGLGTGLSTLRERLQLTFGGDAKLHVSEIQPHGVCVEVEFPARKGAA